MTNIEINNIIIKYDHYIRKIVRKYINDSDDSKDVSQDTIEKILKYHDTYEGKAKISTWIYSIARNCALDFLNKQKRENLRSPIEGSFSSSFNTNRELELGIISAIRSCLSKREIEAYIISAFFQFTSVKGSDILGISPATFRKRISRARKKLASFERCHCMTVNGNYHCNFNPYSERNKKLYNHLYALSKSADFFSIKEKITKLS